MGVQKVGKRLSESKRPLDLCVLVDERVVICSKRSRKGRIQVLLWNQTCARGADGEVDDARRHLRLAEPKALVLVGLRTSSSPPMELSKLSSNNTPLFVLRKVADFYGIRMKRK